MGLRMVVRILTFHCGAWSLAFSLSLGGEPCAIYTSLAVVMFVSYKTLKVFILFLKLRNFEIFCNLFQSLDHTTNAFQYLSSCFNSCTYRGSWRTIQAVKTMLAVYDPEITIEDIWPCCHNERRVGLWHYTKKIAYPTSHCSRDY